MYQNLRQFPLIVPQIFNGLFIFWAIALIFLSLAGYLGKINIYLELASHFKLQYLILSFCPLFFFLIQWWFKSRQNLGVIGLMLSGLCLLINLWEIVPWYFPHHWWRSNVSGEELRVLLSNVNKYQDNSEQAIAFVQQERPDIVVFVEAGTLVSGKLKASLQDILPYSLEHQDTDYDGTIIFSNILLENPAVKSLGGGRKSLLAKLRIAGQDISLIAVHPSKATGEIYFAERNRQLAAIGDYVARLKTPTILVGDMNVTMWSPYYRDLVNKTELNNVRAGFGILPTWPIFQPLLSIPIDHCLVSKEFQVLATRKGRKIGSDHLPLITDIAIAHNRP